MQILFDHIVDFSHWIGIGIMSLLGFLLCRIPYLGKWFRAFDTLIHESGHAIMAMLLGGQAHAIDINVDTSGKTVFSAKSKWRNFLIFTAGYPASAISGFILYVLIHFHHPAWALASVGILILLNAVMWIRNWYGWVWTLVNAIGILLLFYFKQYNWIPPIAILIAACVSLDSVYSCWVLIKLNAKNPSGDAGEMKKITGIPALFFAFLFLIFSLSCMSCSIVLIGNIQTGITWIDQIL